MQGHVFVLFLLALTQIIAWGAVGVLPVIASPVAADLGAALPSVFLGTSVMYVALGIAAPAAGRLFRVFGMRGVMATGAALIGAGLGVVALSWNLLSFWSGWALVGVAGAAFLTTPAYAYLVEVAPTRARSLIGTLMLMTGLAASIFLPVTAFLDHLLGWRGALLVYAGAMAVVVCPLVGIGLPPVVAAPVTASRQDGARRGGIFVLLLLAIALNSFVTFGIQAVGIPLLQAMGLDLARAVAVASLLGAVKVGGRVIDLLGGRRWDGLSTGLVAGAMIPLGLAAPWIGGAGLLPVTGFLLLFGVGSGAFAVARATMPLVFFEKAGYATAMAALALPMNLINALAPPLIAAAMDAAGPRATFALLGGLSALACAVLWQLHRLRPAKAAVKSSRVGLP
ncbi:MFS transporter [Achromobacter xylosoxidans]|uniref:MFS transporter n=1 Tax=Alcaligenes xylosoxydans xylosoxydans TaxID=85698 RepID=UPI001F140BEF|nr:MFS transporter [Achromobacter xylosoxidans]